MLSLFMNNRNDCSTSCASLQIFGIRRTRVGCSRLNWFAVLRLIFAVSGFAATADLDESIRRFRMGTLVVEAPPGVEVRIEQVRHEFWFGAALANHMFGSRADTKDAQKYKEVFLDNFNAAVTENALQWHIMERQQGRRDYSIIDAISRLDRSVQDSSPWPQRLLGHSRSRSIVAEGNGQ